MYEDRNLVYLIVITIHYLLPNKVAPNVGLETHLMPSGSFLFVQNGNNKVKARIENIRCRFSDATYLLNWLAGYV